MTPVFENNEPVEAEKHRLVLQQYADVLADVQRITRIVDEADDAILEAMDVITGWSNTRDMSKEGEIVDSLLNRARGLLADVTARS
jgi:hypothetical protein